MTKQFIDLSHTVVDGLITYQGLPAPIICDYLSREQSRASYAPGTEFHIGKIEMVANTGTYLDSPFHRFAEGPDLAALPLESLAEIEGVLIDVVGKRAIGPECLADVPVKNRAVLFRTGWAQHWQTEQYFSGAHPFLTKETAQNLVAGGAAIVGIDSYNIDDTRDLARPVHTILLAVEIPIVEHLCGLERLPETGFQFSAVPVKVKNFGTFPVRAFATFTK